MEYLQGLFLDFTINLSYLWYALGLGIILDFATGIAKAYKSDGKVCSSKLRDGGFKKCGIILVCVICYGLSFLFNDDNFIISNGAVAYYIYTEIVSILENLIKLGVPLPPALTKILGAMDDKK